MTTENLTVSVDTSSSSSSASSPSAVMDHSKGSTTTTTTTTATTTTATTSSTTTSGEGLIPSFLHSIAATLSPLFTPMKPPSPPTASLTPLSLPDSIITPTPKPFIQEHGEKLHPDYSIAPSFDRLFSTDLGDDVFSDLTLDEAAMTTTTTTRFLSEYTKDGLLKELSLNGIPEGLKALGYTKPVLQLDLTDPFVHRSTLSDLALLDDHENDAKARWSPPPLHSTTSEKDADDDHLRPPKPLHTSRRRSPSPFMSRRPAFPSFVKSQWTAMTSTTTLENVPHPKFDVKDSNFLIDVFARRKKLNVFDVKGYQELVKMCAGEPLDSTFSPTPHPSVLAPTTIEPLPDVTLSPLPTSTALPQKQRQYHLTPSTAPPIKSFLDFHFPSPSSVTIIEWTCMQNPRGTWKLDRPPCPGQKYPGLGIGKAFSEGLINLAKQHKRDALVTVPEHVHNAVFYWVSGYRFLEPGFEGYFQALCEDLRQDIETHGIAAVSWAFHNGHVMDKDGIIEIWHPLEQAIPTSSLFKTYFAHADYNRIVEDSRLSFRNRLHIDWEKATEIHQYSVFYLFGDERKETLES
ncbi:hypothetical protein BC829DRAFT_432558 [Chytridium lagenaria]|nr:hypothetical protein BC829DRAFT_432558 [Chytridium lagenaria]